MLPDWEDPANLPGGRWIVRRDREQLDEAWLELLFYLLGEHSGHSLAREVNGVVVSARKKGDKVAVWLGDARHLAAVVDVGREVRARLGLEAQDRVMFSVHRWEFGRLWWWVGVAYRRLCLYLTCVSCVS